MTGKAGGKGKIELQKLLSQQREANAELVAATVRAQEQAEELARVAEFRELFIGVAGHDLRNPLAAIDLAARQLLRRGQLDEQDRRTAALVLRSSRRMDEMIDQLLDLTRARLGGGLAIEPKRCDLREVCSAVAQEFEAPIELKADGDVTGFWDPDRLAEGLSNLVKNATEHATPGTGIAVAVRAEGAEVVVEVTNEGQPIPAALLPVLFEPFRRAEGRRKSKTGNLGLGLYISDQIVRSHGGSLRARSGGGKTTFTMRLPRNPLRAEHGSLH